MSGVSSRSDGDDDPEQKWSMLVERVWGYARIENWEHRMIVFEVSVWHQLVAHREARKLTVQSNHQ